MPLRFCMISALCLMIALTVPISTLCAGRALDATTQDQCCPELWNTRVNGTLANSPHSTERITASAVDSQGNIYVAGWSTGISGRYSDFVTIKYDPLGNRQWIYDYADHYASADSEGWAIAVDPSGNVYAGGHCTGATGAVDFLLIKFPSNYQQGNAPAWIRTYDGPGKGNDQITDIAVDAYGNVYATGWGYGQASASDYTTIKHDANGNQLWVARYDGGVTGGASDYAYAIVIDAAGDVYVTGRSNRPDTLGDFITVKYNGTNGQRITTWGDNGINRYNGPGNGNDQAVSITTDTAGDVYVTGYSRGSGTGTYDYATIKYDGHTGQPKWWLAGQPGVPEDSYSIAARYNGPGNGNDQPAPPTSPAPTDATSSWISNNQGIVVATEDTVVVYVSGQSENSPGNADFATVKYNGETGQPMWDFGPRSTGGMAREVAARHNGPANSVDRVWAITSASGGGVYVTGPSVASGLASLDFTTIKYSPSGQQQWIARYNGPANAIDQSAGLAVWHDPLGTNWIFVTGNSMGIDTLGRATSNDYCTIKYNGLTGAPAWTLLNQPGATPAKPGDPANIAARFDVESNSSVDHATKIAIDDRSGAIYVTGAMGPWGNYDLITVALSGKTGALLWNGLPEAMDRLDGTGKRNDGGSSIATDAADNVYVAGYATNTHGSQTDSDFAVIKLDGLTGQRVWATFYNGSGSGASDAATDIALDTQGSVYVTGSSDKGVGTDSDYATVKYDRHGIQQWVVRYDGYALSDAAAALAVDSAGNVYVTGTSYGNGTQSDFAIIKYDTHGNLLWVSRFEGPDSDTAADIAVDSSGNVYVTGSCVGSSTNADFCTVKYDGVSGELRWVKRYNGPANLDDSAIAVAIMPGTGDVYVTGKSPGMSTAVDIATVAYRSDGSLLWAGMPGIDAGGAARYSNEQLNDSDVSNGIAIDLAGNVYVVGYSTAAEVGPNYSILKYGRATGKQTLVATYNGTGNSYDFGTAVVVDALGDVYVTGDSVGSETASDVVTIKYRGAADAKVLYLIGKVKEYGLAPGIENSLTSKLENVLSSVAGGTAEMRQDAIGKMNAFVNECQALEGKKLSTDQVNDLLSVAGDIVDILQCSR